MLKRAVHVVGLFLAFSWVSYAQIIPQYSIKAQLLPIEGEIEVEQRMVFSHNGSTPLNEIYLVDWNHAFSSTESPLAKRLVEEYTRSFLPFQQSKREKHKLPLLHLTEKISNGNASRINWIKYGFPPTPLQAKEPLRLVLNTV